MRIIISPAKKMNIDLENPVDVGVPLFLDKTEQLLHALQAMEGGALQTLWNCNDSLARLNQERLEHMDLHAQLTPALFSYEGIQYRYMAPHVLEGSQLAYLQQHLRILSGFYGMLRPFDGVRPYRLELQSKLAVGNHKHLYDFWGSTLADALCKESKCILNLASAEYSRAIAPHLPQGVTMITCTFAQPKGDTIVEKGTLCKMARGQMVRWLAENAITRAEDIPHFNQLGYGFSPEHSSPTQFVFLKSDSL